MNTNEASPLAAVSAEIDAVNRADPTRLSDADGSHPQAWLEGRRARHWVEALRPDASDPLRLAAHAHHLRRWEMPRDSYPETRAGYHAWRSALYDFHGQALGELMASAGYASEEVTAARELMSKRRIKTDRDAQSYEDAVSLAFLETRLGAFAPTVSAEQLGRALRRTLRKMSDEGRAAAAAIELPPLARSALEAGAALDGGDPA